jgi:chemotaxis protein CheD
MPLPDDLIPQVYLQPGESRLVREPAILRTVLGSCVGITFHVPRLGIGALCHPMLPRCPAHRLHGSSGEADRRYVDFAIRDIARQLDSLGAARNETRVKMFGGGDVLPFAGGTSRPTVGKMNSEAAMQVLDQEGFTVSACRVGGASGVHIQFDTATGEVLLRQLDSGAVRGAKS